MKVSIIMPMRNAAPFVRAAALSVLAEKTVSLELLIIDDGSVDGSASVVSAINDTRIRLLPGPQRGISACLNKGLEHAKGEIIMRCDADDLYPPGRIQKQVTFLQDAPDVVAVCGGFDMIDDGDLTLSQPFYDLVAEPIDISHELIAGELRTSFCTFAVRRAAFEQLSGFREYFVSAEDIDFAYRLGSIGKVFFCYSSCYKYRIHDASITHNIASSRRIFFDEMAEIFAKQRLKFGQDDLMLGKAPSPPSEKGTVHDAAKHSISLMIGNAWNMYEQGRLGPALAFSIKVLVRFPLFFSAWILVTKMTLKVFVNFIISIKR